MYRWGFKSELEEEYKLSRLPLDLWSDMDHDTFQKAVNSIH